MSTNQPALPSTLYVTFSGMIEPTAVQKFMNALTMATTGGVSTAHLMFQSMGGFAGDAVCLYNFFRSLPIELIIYNSGTVQSAAFIAYLGAKKRKTSAHATFMIHHGFSTVQLASAVKLKGITKSIALDNANVDAIVRQNTNLGPETLGEMANQEVWFSAQEAVNAGIAHEIGEFSPPTGGQVYTI